jgi:hypothetical protein
MKTKAFLRSRDQGKRAQMRLAYLKTHHGFECLRLRGLPGARDEFRLAVIVQNLKTMGAPPVRAAARTSASVTCADGVNIAITPTQSGAVI